VEGKTNFSRRLKQFDDLTWLTLTVLISRQIYATAAWAEVFAPLSSILVSPLSLCLLAGWLQKLSNNYFDEVFVGEWCVTSNEPFDFGADPDQEEVRRIFRRNCHHCRSGVG